MSGLKPSTASGRNLGGLGPVVGYSVRDRGCADFSLPDESVMFFLPGSAARRGGRSSPRRPLPGRIPETAP